MAIDIKRRQRFFMKLGDPALRQPNGRRNFFELKPLKIMVINNKFFVFRQ